MLIDGLPKLISEADAYERWPELLEAKELRRARVEGKLGYYRRKKKILYREDELVAFIAGILEASFTPPRDDRKTKGAPAPCTSGIPGMTPELERAASELLRRRSFRRPRSRA